MAFDCFLYNDAKLLPKWILREIDISRIGPRLGGLPYLERLHGKIWPRLRGIPGLAGRATRLGGSPHLSCKRDQIKMRDHMDRRVTPPKRVTLPTWGAPPPCKQAVKILSSKMTLWTSCILSRSNRKWGRVQHLHAQTAFYFYSNSWQ